MHAGTFSRAALIAGIALAAGPGLADRALAAGGSTPSQPVKVCIKRDDNGNCIKWQQSAAPESGSGAWARAGSGDMPPAYLEAVWLAKAGRFGEALARLEELNMPDNADVLNYLGYTNRKLGRIDKGISYYKKALAIAPEHAGANEYLGEAYLQKGNLAAAKARLEKLEAICGGRACEEYQDLAEEIRKYETEGRG